MTARGIVVVEVERPDRRLRRNKGKSDTIDAEAAARKVLSGQATVVPKSADGNVEMIRVLRLARRSALTGGTKADLDTLRRLKRYIAREVYPLLRDALSDQQDAVPEAA